MRYSERRTAAEIAQVLRAHIYSGVDSNFRPGGRPIPSGRSLAEQRWVDGAHTSVAQAIKMLVEENLLVPVRGGLIVRPGLVLMEGGTADETYRGRLESLLDCYVETEDMSFRVAISHAKRLAAKDRRHHAELILDRINAWDAVIGTASASYANLASEFREISKLHREIYRLIDNILLCRIGVDVRTTLELSIGHIAAEIYASSHWPELSKLLNELVEEGILGGSCRSGLGRAYGLTVKAATLEAADAQMKRLRHVDRARHASNQGS